MSIILQQKAIQAVLLVGLKQIQKNTEIRNTFLANYSDFDATFRQFKDYALSYNIPLENCAEPIEEIQKFIKATEFNVKLGYPRLNAMMPEICIVLGNENEGSGVIGDIADETRDESGNQKIKWNSDKQKSLSIHIVDNNPDSVDILHSILDYILVTHRTLLTQMGLADCRFDASDVHPNQEGLQSGVFLFERVITVACEVFQTYETSFYGYSPMPTQVAISSELIEEDDVDVDDLEEEVEVETTPPKKDGEFCIIGDQIPKDTSMEMLFRGTTVESVITENIVTKLEVSTFEQQIVGEFVFEAAASFIVFAYPKILGELTFEIEGNIVNFYRQDMIIDNSSGNPVDYFVYRSELTYTGTKVVKTIKV